MRPTIYDVAERAGVSIATVSRVLNGSPKPTAATRDRVLAAVRTLGYQPSAAARCLARSTTETIALVFPEVSSPFFVELIRGIELEARRHHYHVLIYGLHGEGKQDQLLRFLSTKVDGMILGAQCDEAYVRTLHRQGLPFVLMGRRVEGLAVTTIRSNGFEGAYAAVTHLIRHGYGSIAALGGPEASQQSRIRLRAYAQALDDHGWHSDVRWIVHADYHESGGQAAMAGLLALPRPPRAVFVANDQMAIGALEAVRDAGKQVPGDVALVGFDDIPMASYVHPTLTTVRQDIYESGELAVQLLIRQIEDPATSVETILLPTRLVIRQSCGCDEREVHHPNSGV